MPVYRISPSPIVIAAPTPADAYDALKVYVVSNMDMTRWPYASWDDQDAYIQETGGNIDMVVEPPPIPETET